jgi:hypothetical protein
MTSTFGDRYYGEPRPESSGIVDGRGLQDRLPKDTEQQVKAAYKKWNQRVRNRLDEETRLYTAIDGGRSSLRLKIVEGLPLAFAQVLREFDDPDVWWLTAHRGLFASTRDGLAALSEAVRVPRRLVQECGADGAFQDKLNEVTRVVSAVLEAHQTEQLVHRLRQIDHDVLGAYFFYRGEVHLYWMVIGFYASILNVSVEDLTIVVLTHELAHVYTHIGMDVDGSRWDVATFAAADLRIVEGLAQLYTDRALRRLAQFQPGARTAFDELLGLQSLPYTIFQEWIEGEAQGEDVRAAMIQARNSRITDYDEFRRALEHIKTAGEVPVEFAPPVR